MEHPECYFADDRRRRLRRSGVSSLVWPGGAISNFFRPGRAACCRRFHSSIGDKTATGIPSRVISCGPLFSVLPNNLLKCVFASCSSHESTILPSANSQPATASDQLFRATDAAPFEAALRYRTNCYPCVGCNTRNVVPPLDQTRTSASSPFATLPSSFCTSAAECTG